MAFTHLEPIDIHHLTMNQPFCGGTLVFHEGTIVVTLNSDGLPAHLHNNMAYRVGGVGGGQEQGETVWECALREAQEELSTPVTLQHSPITYFHDLDSGEIQRIQCTNTVAPLLLERQSNLYPYTPYRPGLPGGPYTYFCIFLAQGVQHDFKPGDDIAGLLYLPPALWARLTQQPTLESILQQGAALVEQSPLARDKSLWTHPWESFHTVIALLQKHPEIFLT